MKPHSSLVVRALALACTACSAGAAEPLSVASAATAATAGFAAERLDRLAAFMQRATDSRGYLGAVTIVARHGTLVQWQAFGQRDLARSAPMPRDAIFRIYSMTKTVASVAALMLMEEGRLALEDPIALYLPAFANARVFAGGSADAPQLVDAQRPVTVRHLLTHSAGFATGGKGLEQSTLLLERSAPSHAADLEGFAERVASVPLAAQPGARFGYDGVNTEVLARLVEVASGERFDAFVQRRIFAPLRMADTGFAVPAAKRARIAEISAMGADGRLTLAPGRSAAAPGEMLNAYVSGAGGLYSTAPDWLRFCQMLLNGGELDGARLLGRKTVEAMLSNHLTQLEMPIAGLNPGESFGLGGAVVVDAARRGRLGSVGSFGWSGAASTYFTIDPQEQLIAILLLQHLPRDAAADLPKLNVRFGNLVYQALR